jgi:O-antigen/teichoic acid export membrane protein
VFFLAVMLAGPLAVIPNAVATSSFRRFAEKDQIPLRVLGLAVAATGVAYLAFLFSIHVLVRLIYRPEFLPAATLACLLGAGTCMQGIAELYNRFLGSHGRGKDIRNGAFAVGIVTIASFAVLLPAYGMHGAVAARLIVDLSYFTVMVRQYLRYRSTHDVAESELPRGRLSTGLAGPV